MFGFNSSNDKPVGDYFAPVWQNKQEPDPGFLKRMYYKVRGRDLPMPIRTVATKEQLAEIMVRHDLSREEDHSAVDLVDWEGLLENLN